MSIGRQKQIAFLLTNLKNNRLWKCKILKRTGNHTYVLSEIQSLVSTYFYIANWNKLAILHRDDLTDYKAFFVQGVGKFVNQSNRGFKLSKEEPTSAFDEKTAADFYYLSTIKENLKPFLNKNIVNVIAQYGPLNQVSYCFDPIPKKYCDQPSKLVDVWLDNGYLPAWHFVSSEINGKYLYARVYLPKTIDIKLLVKKNPIYASRWIVFVTE